MKKRELNDIINLLNSLTQTNRDKKLLVNEFQNKIWNMNDSSCEFKILNELANDLDYYEPDPEIRDEDSSYYDDDRLLKEIKSAIDRLLSSSQHNYPEHIVDKMKDKVQLLIDILLDKTAREDERGDAAINLREYKHLRALEALTKIASDPNEDDVIIDNCAESIGEICSAMGYFNENFFRKMVPFAQKIVLGFITTHNPKLIKQSLNTNLLLSRESPNYGSCQMAINLLEIFHRHFGSRSNFSEDDYLHSYGKCIDAILYSLIFMPELIEIETRIFLKRNVYSELVVRNELNNSRTAREVEINYNFLEIGYIFDANGRDISEDEETFLANRIRDSWDGWLKVKYPNRKFVVTVISSEETGSTKGVQFYETS